MSISKRNSFNKDGIHFADDKEWIAERTGRNLDDALRGLKQVALGIPRGFFGTVPNPIVIGGAGSPGTEAEGWMSAGAIPPAPASAPTLPILLGTTSLQGATGLAVDAGFRQNTITLQRQIRALISLGVG